MSDEISVLGEQLDVGALDGDSDVAQQLRRAAARIRDGRGTVRSLTLFSCGLSSLRGLPPELGATLTSMNLSSNEIGPSFALLPELLDLARLVSLDLSSNRLQRVTPPRARAPLTVANGVLPSLEVLCVSYNRIASLEVTRAESARASRRVPRVGSFSFPPVARQGLDEFAPSLVKLDAHDNRLPLRVAADGSAEFARPLRGLRFLSEMNLQNASSRPGAVASVGTGSNPVCASAAYPGVVLRAATVLTRLDGAPVTPAARAAARDEFDRLPPPPPPPLEETEPLSVATPLLDAAAARMRSRIGSEPASTSPVTASPALTRLERMEELAHHQLDDDDDDDDEDQPQLKSQQERIAQLEDQVASLHAALLTGGPRRDAPTAPAAALATPGPSDPANPWASPATAAPADTRPSMAAQSAAMDRLAAPPQRRARQKVVATADEAPAPGPPEANDSERAPTPRQSAEGLATVAADDAPGCEADAPAASDGASGEAARRVAASLAYRVVREAWLRRLARAFSTWRGLSEAARFEETIAASRLDGASDARVEVETEARAQATLVDETLRDARNELATERDAAARATEALLDAEKRVAAAEADAASARARADVMLSTMSDAKHDSQQRVAALELERNAALTTAARADAERERADQMANDARSELAALRTTRESADAQLAAVRSELADVSRTAAEARAEAAKLEQDSARAIALAVDKARAEAAQTAQASHAELASALETARASARAKVEQLQAAFEKAAQTAAESKAAANAAITREETLRAATAELSELARAQKAELRAAREDRRTHATTLASLQAELAGERDRALAADAALARLRPEVEAATARFDAAEADARAARAELTTAAARGDEMSATLSIKEKMLDDQNEALRELRHADARAADAARDRDALDDECGALRGELRELEERLVAQADIERHLRSIIDELRRGQLDSAELHVPPLGPASLGAASQNDADDAAAGRADADDKSKRRANKRDAALSEALDEVGRLREQLEAKDQALRYVEGELLGMRSLFDGKEAALKAQLTADLERASATETELRAALEGARKERDGAMLAADSAKTNVLDLERDVKELRANVESERDAKAGLERRLRAIVPRYEQQAAELARLKDALRAVDSAVGSARGVPSAAS